MLIHCVDLPALSPPTAHEHRLVQPRLVYVDDTFTICHERKHKLGIFLSQNLTSNTVSHEWYSFDALVARPKIIAQDGTYVLV